MKGWEYAGIMLCVLALAVLSLNIAALEGHPATIVTEHTRSTQYTEYHTESVITQPVYVTNNITNTIVVAPKPLGDCFEVINPTLGTRKLECTNT